MDNVQEEKSKKNKEIKSAIFQNLISVPVLTILITSLAAPIVTHLINTGIKNKELQISTLNKLIEITDKANFKDLDEKHKMKIIAEIIENNQGLFKFENFNKTKMIFDEVFNQALPGGIVGLQNEVMKNKKELTDAQNKLAETGSKLDLLMKQSLDLKLINDEINKKLLNESERSKLSEDEISELENTLDNNKNIIDENSEKIKTYEEQLKSLEKKARENAEAFIKSQEKLTESAEKNKILQEEVKTYKRTINNQNATTQELKTELRKALKQIEDLNDQLKQYSFKKDEINRLHSEINRLNEMIKSNENQSKLLANKKQNIDKNIKENSENIHESESEDARKTSERKEPKKPVKLR
ncbi:MAG: hypothetical protein OEZ22_09820 [Spirochaetia bacterium]|nr:hypothetical protein [Spirochaetia bacterium]